MDKIYDLSCIYEFEQLINRLNNLRKLLNIYETSDWLFLIDLLGISPSDENRQILVNDIKEKIKQSIKYYESKINIYWDGVRMADK